MVHNMRQYLTHSLTTTENILGKRWDQANKQAVDTESSAFEVKKLRASSRNEVQILKATMKHINRRIRSVKAGEHPDIPKVNMSVSDLMKINIDEEYLD